MKKLITIAGLILLLLVAAFATERYASAPIQRTLKGIYYSIFSTPIKDVIDNPRNYISRPVTIYGEVTDVFSFFVLKYFVVRDDTGEIVVVTDKPLPGRGTRISVTGTVEEAFSLGDRQLLVLLEKKEK